MTSSRRFYIAAFLAVSLGLSACVTTTMRTVKQEPGFSVSRVQKVMIIYLGKNQMLRQELENEFVKQWNKRGVDAIPSLTALPPGTVLEKTQVAPIAKAQGFDTVLVTRVLG